MAKSITKAELEQMLQQAQAKNEQLANENQKLRSAMSRRPADALVISTNLVFQKGSHQELVGKTLKLSVPAEALGALYISGEVKRNSNGNAYCWATGYIDTSKLNLQPVESSTAAKATKSFKTTVVDS
jgi:hypothetical protein